MAKAPFERVFSLIERKKLLQKVLKDKSKIVLRGSKSQVLEFRPSGIEANANLLGDILGGTIRDFEKVTALFYVDSDRYFMTTKIKKKDERWVLLNDAQFYKLNRRAAFRVQVPASIELSFHISTIRNIEVNRSVTVIEFSTGGARIAWTASKKLSKGTILKGSLQWGKGKLLPIDAIIVHSPDDGIYGLRFINLTSVSINRLKMLSVEVQQIIHFG